jgi:16S rRNA G527 N7-methylase RsmG
MNPTRISALLEPFLTHTLSEQQLNQISIYIDLLQRWNARINLTAIRNEEEIVTRHFGESLFLARHLFPQTEDSTVEGTTGVERSARVERTLLSAKAKTAEMFATPTSSKQCHPERSYLIREADDMAESKDLVFRQHDPSLTSSTSDDTIKDQANRQDPRNPNPRNPTGNWQPASGNRALDIGSGAGFPALPLKIWAPEIHLTLIESNHKKSAFLKEVSRALTFTNINVISERAEVLSAQADFPRTKLVTLRAVEHFEAILPVAVNFLTEKGTVALLIGASQLPLPSKRTTLKWEPPIPIPQSNSRVLLLGYKQP